ncbi:M1 family aminopeptidase [Dyadobacter chenhuakuii]|uniref:Aminopeptidase N n=1 Tax=Dyadobacter chenhuakuii TaxID=2909339 RepID=A0ABY4XRB7_9BACT|nr:M1 family aminopeptidase [Dyadobacter chenhuakuii]MCF2492723.1 T9SS type A sorting domain-containing protein [Dyadobacter chenhuakuii]USJ32986.1 T9SS type A sorting domain-containing protein [Dyadobacter chenhuakuii]
MRLILLLFIMIAFVHVQAQFAPNYQEEIERISQMEQKGFQRRRNGDLANARTSASQNFDVKYYRCEWEVDPAVRYIKGVVTTHFVMTSSGNSITLDLANEHIISSVTRNNVALSFTHMNGAVTVSFPVPIAGGVKDSISISYGGVPTTAFSPFTTATHGPNQDPAMWTLSEPFGAKDWWPCKNGLDDKADSIDVYIKHPAIYKAASNGLLKSETPVAGSGVITHWKHRYPIASYLVYFAVSNYNVLNNSVDINGTAVPMQTYCYPENQATFATGAQNAMNAMVQFSNLLGDYPFKKEKYGHVQFAYGGGMEHQTCSFMVNMGENLIAHELAHHWFGDKITCGNWEHIWLNEGFATHMASIYIENKFPANATVYRNAQINAITADSGGSVRVDDVNNPNRIFSQRLSYYKGSHLLYMLRWILSDAVFFSGVKNYLQDPALAYGFATTNDLKSHLEAVSGKDLTYFFDQWFIGEGYPSYKVQWFPEGNNVQIKVSQTTSHASVGFFKLPLPILFQNTGTGQQKLVVVDHTTNDQVFLENLGFEPNLVTFDPEKWLISKNNVITKSSDPLPVTFETVKVQCLGDQPQLIWTTSEELNADHFEIQKSSNAVNWSKIGSVEAAGNSTDLKHYTYTDYTTQANGDYYRIAEQDMDGKVQYSRILRNTCGTLQKSDLIISPNPVADLLHFRTNGENRGGMNVSIYNADGHLERLEHVSQTNSNSINVSAMQHGVYILQVEDVVSKSIKAVRFMKE